MVVSFINNEAKLVLLRCIFIFCFLILVLGNINSFAQSKQAAIWHVGNKRLDFNTNPVTVTDITSFFGKTNSASIANTNGKLLFHYYLETIYDKNLSIIPNGQSIIPMISPLFIPKPNHNNIYYLIDNYNYTLIDSSLNNGNGDVIEKNIQWNTITQSRIQAVHHSNCKDIWLVGINDTAFVSYLLTENGISDIPIISYHTDADNFAISPSGKYYSKLGFINNGGTSSNFLTIDFGEFDRNLGVFTRTYYYQTSIYARAFNISFSPDNSKLYFNAQIRTDTDHFQLIQVNIVNGIPDFDHSIIISTYNTGSIWIPGGGMRLGIDGKIYELFSYLKKINVISNPNYIGLGCNYQQNLQTINMFGSTLPNFISTWFSNNYCILEFYAENTCLPESTQFTINSVNNVQSVLWNFGDSQTSIELNPTHIYTIAGTYTVSLTVTYTNNSTQTVTKQITVNQKPQNISITHD